MKLYNMAKFTNDTRGMNPLKDDDGYFEYDGVGEYGQNSGNIGINRMEDIMDSNLIINFPGSGNKVNKYNKFNRYGYIDPFSKEVVLKEFLFFTKPDLNIFAKDGTLHKNLAVIPFFSEAALRHRAALWQLQTTNCPNEFKGPFMNLLTNTVSSKLDLPDISADSNNTTGNVMGTEIAIRSHSYKSDNSFDFTLSFNDSAYLEVYTMVKAYDEYMRLLQTGEHHPFKKYIRSNTISDQFSIYKILIGDDGETIQYFAKVTGAFFTNVPRTDLNDPGNDLGKISVSFKGQFVEDSNPVIAQDFNRVVARHIVNKDVKYANVFDYGLHTVDNSWCILPFIEKASDNRSNRRAPHGSNSTYYDLRLKWTADPDHVSNLSNNIVSDKYNKQYIAGLHNTVSIDDTTHVKIPNVDPKQLGVDIITQSLFGSLGIGIKK